jgi:RHS repeat-associated protein
VRVYSGGNVTDTYYIGDHFEVRGGETIKYIFAGNLRVAQVKGGVRSFFHKDHLGSSTVMTDENGARIEATEYMPFGSQRSHWGTNTSDYRFTDQELDAENGLYNYNARMYDPIIGRFLSADSIVPEPFNPQSLNRYTYCLNNPLIYIDPSGHASEDSSWLGEWWNKFVDIVGRTFRWTIKSVFGFIGNSFMKTMEWVSERNIWGVKGIAEAAMGIGNIIGGAVTGDFSQMGKGVTQIGKAVYDTAESAVVDAAAVAIGQLSHLYTIPRDLINIGQNLLGTGEEGETTLGAIGTTLMDIAVPRYGLGGGAGYGVYRDKTTGEYIHTFGNRFVNSPLNEADAANFQHDRQYKHSVWVVNQMSFNDQPRISGLGGLAYKALGVVPFGIAGILQNKGIAPQPSF